MEAMYVFIGPDFNSVADSLYNRPSCRKLVKAVRVMENLLKQLTGLLAKGSMNI